MITKEIGKITSVSFGFGGYQDAMIGLNLSFKGQSWSVGDFHGTWASGDSEASDDWPSKEQASVLMHTLRLVHNALRDAKVDSVDKLLNIPVEVTFEGQTIKGWRILTEVL